MSCAAIALERIHRARADQAFDHAPVNGAEVHLLAELVDACGSGRSLRAPLRMASTAFWPRFLTAPRPKRMAGAVRREVPVARVHVRRQHRDAHLAALVDVLHHLVGVARFRRQQRGHEVDRVVRLQVAGDVGQERVGGRVRLVEAVARELLHQVEDLLDLLLREAALERALDEALALLGHLLGLLLAHGAAQQVGLAQRVAGQAIGDLHHLFLVDDDAVGLFEDLLQLRQVVDDRLAAVLAVDEVVDHAALNRAGAVERVQRGQVFDAVRAASGAGCRACPAIRTGTRRW